MPYPKRVNVWSMHHHKIVHARSWTLSKWKFKNAASELQITTPISQRRDGFPSIVFYSTFMELLLWLPLFGTTAYIRGRGTTQFVVWKSRCSTCSLQESIQLEVINPYQIKASFIGILTVIQWSIIMYGGTGLELEIYPGRVRKPRKRDSLKLSTEYWRSEVMTQCPKAICNPRRLEL